MIDVRAAHDLAVEHGMTPDPNWNFEGFIRKLSVDAEERGIRGGLDRAAQECRKIATKVTGAADRAMDQVQNAIRDGNKAKAEECLGFRKTLIERMNAMEHVANEISAVARWDDHGSALVRFHANGAALIHNPACRAIHQAALYPEVRANFSATLTVEELAAKLACHGADREVVAEVLNLILFGISRNDQQAA